ncbi:hypothetical protein C9374_006564 [Naegleria lovaniensis]|uniref:Uncharacterized protein n=1 Tax=Naegleria lovaniensis TaxID=51637 RepID=A0AA88GHB8_NAELO|nr:uncharacterized protein C9374_006564 [Naegleria lovaniensis]KAG2379447.1 hypothetical protein C9374_006564 [Naegleria lovaniensis]
MLTGTSTSSAISTTPLFDSLPKEDFHATTREYLRSITQQVSGALIRVPKKEIISSHHHDHHQQQQQQQTPVGEPLTEEDECIVFYQAYNSTIANYAVKHQTFKGCSAFDMKRMTWIKPNYLWMMYRSEFATAWNQTNILALYIQREYFEKVILENAVCSMYYPELERYYGSRKEWEKACSRHKQKAGQYVNKIKKKEHERKKQQFAEDSIQELVKEQMKMEKEYSNEEEQNSSQHNEPIAQKTSRDNQIQEEANDSNEETTEDEEFIVGFARVQWDPYHTPAFGKVHGGLTRAIQIGLKGTFITNMVKCGALRKIEDITDYVKQQHEKYKESGEITIPVERFIEIHNESTCKKLGIVERIPSQQ